MQSMTYHMSPLEVGICMLGLLFPPLVPVMAVMRLAGTALLLPNVNVTVTAEEEPPRETLMGVPARIHEAIEMRTYPFSWPDTPRSLNAFVVLSQLASVKLTRFE